MSDAVTGKLPNYPAYVLLIILCLPLIWIEIDFEAATSSKLFVWLEGNMGIYVFFQFLLIVFVSAQSVIVYDSIHKYHRGLMNVFNGVFIFTWLGLLIAYLGYFNAGLKFFVWLNE